MTRRKREVAVSSATSPIVGPIVGRSSVGRIFTPSCLNVGDRKTNDPRWSYNLIKRREDPFETDVRLAVTWPRRPHHRRPGITRPRNRTRPLNAKQTPALAGSGDRSTPYICTHRSALRHTIATLCQNKIFSTVRRTFRRVEPTAHAHFSTRRPLRHVVYGERVGDGRPGNEFDLVRRTYRENKMVLRPVRLGKCEKAS